MDRSLSLLMRLRAGAAFRRLKRTLSRPKGIAMAAITAALFVPWLISIVMTSRVPLHPPLEQIRRFGPLGVFVFAVGSLLFSAGEQALYFTPAEVTFLFAGPYRKRQLLAYKLIVTIVLCLFSSLFIALGTRIMSPMMISAMVGSFLLVVFLQMLQMVVGLAGATLGALAWSRGRRIILVAVISVIGLACLSAGRGLGSAGPLEALSLIENSAVATAALLPFRWFILAFTAERVWPDLIVYATLCLALDAVLVALVFAFDASYLEAASTASARRFAKLQRLMGGGGGVRSMATRKVGRFRFRPPAAPWWGGVGPNLWRQMTAALGDPGRLVAILGGLSLVPIMMIFLVRKESPQNASLPQVCLGMIAWMSIVLSFLLPYDFRGDIDMMEELKTLPIAPSRLALGQILTPTLVATLSQALAMITVVVGLGSSGILVWTTLAFLLPINLIFYSIENLLFLWYPSRIVAGQFDVMAIGRQMLFMLAKMAGLALGVGLAALSGTIVYFVAGRNVPASLVVAWVVVSGSALGLIPLVGKAFTQFDVSRDVPA